MLMGLCEAKRLTKQPKNVDTVMQKFALQNSKNAIIKIAKIKTEYPPQYCIY